jgi:hypothetical protein
LTIFCAVSFGDSFSFILNAAWHYKRKTDAIIGTFEVECHFGFWAQSLFIREATAGVGGMEADAPFQPFICVFTKTPPKKA